MAANDEYESDAMLVGEEAEEAEEAAREDDVHSHEGEAIVVGAEAAREDDEHSHEGEAMVVGEEAEEAEPREHRSHAALMHTDIHGANEDEPLEPDSPEDDLVTEEAHRSREPTVESHRSREPTMVTIDSLQQQIETAYNANAPQLMALAKQLDMDIPDGCVASALQEAVVLTLLAMQQQLAAGEPASSFPALPAASSSSPATGAASSSSTTGATASSSVPNTHNGWAPEVADLVVESLSLTNQIAADYFEGTPENSAIPQLISLLQEKLTQLAYRVSQ